MTYTAENPHADGSAAPGARFRPPRHREPHDTSPAPTTTGWREDRCPVVSKQTLHSRAVTAHSHRPGARPDRPCPVPACSGQPLPGKRAEIDDRFKSSLTCFLLPNENVLFSLPAVAVGLKGGGEVRGVFAVLQYTRKHGQA